MTWYYNQEDTQPKQYKMYNQKRLVFQKYTKNLAPNMRQTQQYQEKKYYIQPLPTGFLVTVHQFLLHTPLSHSIKNLISFFVLIYFMYFILFFYYFYLAKGRVLNATIMFSHAFKTKNIRLFNLVNINKYLCF